jgi:hypothetical protein
MWFEWFASRYAENLYRKLGLPALLKWLRAGLSLPLWVLAVGLFLQVTNLFKIYDFGLYDTYSELGLFFFAICGFVNTIGTAAIVLDLRLNASDFASRDQGVSTIDNCKHRGKLLPFAMRVAVISLPTWTLFVGELIYLCQCVTNPPPMR